MEPRYAIPFRRRQEALRERRRARSRDIMERLRAAASEAGSLFPSITRVTAFGSVADGRATEASDVDVLVEGLPADAYYPLRRLLSDRLDREVDLHTDTEPSEFVRRIRDRGRCAYERES